MRLFALLRRNLLCLGGSKDNSGIHGTMPTNVLIQVHVAAHGDDDDDDDADDDDHDGDEDAIDDDDDDDDDDDEVLFFFW